MEKTKLIKQNLVQIIMNDDQVKEMMILNLIKMLNSRNIIDKNNISMYTSLAYTQINQNDETYFDLNNEETNRLGSNKIHIKFINRKITTIRKVIDIENFMDNVEYKFVIVKQIAPKAINQIIDYKNTELFYDIDLQINLIDHIFVPKHYKLSPDEIQNLIESYKFNPKNAKRMYLDDPISKYYNLKIDDIVRIERPSKNSGISIDYRVVFPGSIYK